MHVHQHGFFKQTPIRCHLKHLSGTDRTAGCLLPIFAEFYLHCTARQEQLVPFTHILLLTQREADKSRSFSYSTALQHFPPQAVLTRLVLRPHHAYREQCFTCEPVRPKACSWNKTKASRVYLTLTLPSSWTDSVLAELKILQRASGICPDAIRALCLSFQYPDLGSETASESTKPCSSLQLCSGSPQLLLALNGAHWHLLSHPISVLHGSEDSVDLHRTNTSLAMFLQGNNTFP